MNITAPKFDGEEIKLIQEALDSGWVTQGPFIQKFETLFKKRHNVEHALSVTSCTAALHLAVYALGLGEGDEVIVPAFTWITSANCVEYVGAKTVFADVDPDTFNLCPNAFEAAITPRTRAVLPVHLFGLSADMDPILKIAKKHNLFVIEDAACAIGSTYKGNLVGGFGDAGCFSFHPRKVITTGEGGMLTTNSGELAKKVFSLRSHGGTGIPVEEIANPRPYTMATFNYLGYNYRLSDVLGAIGVAQIAKLDGLLKERFAAAQNYYKLLENVEGILTPKVPEGYGHTYQSFVIRIVEGGTIRRNAIMDMLEENGIQTRPGTHAVHRLGYYAEKYGLKPEAFPVASACEDLSITLPIFPGMTFAQQEVVANLIKELN